MEEKYILWFHFYSQNQIKAKRSLKQVMLSTVLGFRIIVSLGEMATGRGCRGVSGGQLMFDFPIQVCSLYRCVPCTDVFHWGALQRNATLIRWYVNTWLKESVHVSVTIRIDLSVFSITVCWLLLNGKGNWPWSCSHTKNLAVPTRVCMCTQEWKSHFLFFSLCLVPPTPPAQHEPPAKF